MTDSQFARLAEIVPEALEQPDDARDAYLDAACRQPDGTLDAPLRAEADTLVAAALAADAADALRSPVTGLSGAGPARLPETIGPWRVTGVLGEGGMGVVYRARRADGTLDRDVAVKRLHPAVGRALAGRLDLERDALARLEHDGVARLYDAGVDDDGAPFLVLECVDGQPLTEHADAAGLDVRARVALFAQVCDAVAYAHQRLTVHRDLKPSNVFVTPDGRPKLLDFGIAKWLGEADSGSFAETLTRTQAAMTPSYAAPEQVRRGEVTTATDVYALGVMLYEILAGQRPYALSGTTPAEAERIVCETDPPPPSAVAPAERARTLRGDLDRIVGKAMAKEPARRYASAEALGDDLRRFLHGLPVRARPATAGYRARRFVRRHRAGVAAATVAVLALAVGAGVALAQAREARAEAAKAEAVSGFLLDLLNAPNAEVDGRDVRVASLLDQAARDLDSAFAGTPTTEAALRHTLGTTYRSLALYDEADLQLRRALALRLRLLGPGHVETAEVQESLGRLYNDRALYPRADSLLQLALATYRRRLPSTHERISFALNDLGQTQYEQGDYAGAARYWREALDIDEAAKPPTDKDRLIAMENLALALFDSGDHDGGVHLLEEQVRLLRRHRPDDDLILANSLANLGSLYRDRGRPGDALPLQREALARFERVHGAEHPHVAFALNNLGSTLAQLGRRSDAEPLLRRSVRLYRSAFGVNYANHPDVGFPLINLAGVLLDLNQPEAAREALDEAERVLRAGLSPTHPALARLVPLRERITAAGL